MKKKLLLTLMLLVAASATMSAQEVQTSEPFIDPHPMSTDEFVVYPTENHIDKLIYQYYTVSIMNTDETDAVIYYRTLRNGYPSEWMVYDGYEVVCTEEGITG